MATTIRVRPALALATAALLNTTALAAQALSPELLEALRRGAEAREIPAGRARVPLLGAPELFTAA